MNGTDPAGGSGLLSQPARALRELDGLLSGPRAAAVGAVLAMAFVVALRLPAVEARPVGGIDYGHYLATLHWLTGAEPTQFGNEGLFGYHAILGVLSLLFGEAQATVVSGPLMAASLVPAGFVLGRRFMPALPSLAGATLLACTQNFSDMIAWGGNPNLLAMSFSLAMWSYFLDLVNGLKAGTAARRPALLAGLFLGLVVLTHSFTALITVATLAAFVGAVVVLRVVPVRAIARPALEGAAVAALVSLPAAPLYATLLTAGSLGGAGASAPPWETVAASVEYLNRDTPYLWLAAGGIAAVAAGVLAARREPFGILILASLAVPLALALTAFSTLAARTLYFLDPPLAIGAAAASWILWQRRAALLGVPASVNRPAVLALAVALLVLVPTTSVVRQEEAVRFYNRLTPEHLAALDWLREHSARGEAAWTSGPIGMDPSGRAGEPFGFWIEGYARRPALYTARPEDLAFAYQQAAARDACRVFQGDRGAENGFLRVGVGATLAVAVQPTVAIVSGLDYRVVVSGQDLGLEAGARTYRLSSGVYDTANATNASEFSAWFENAASFQAPNNWTGSASANLSLNGSSASYRIAAQAPGNIRPWIHKSFLVAPDAVRVETVGANNSSSQALRYFIPQTATVPSAHFTLTFSIPDPLSNLSIAVAPSYRGDVVDVVVSGRAPSPVLVAQFRWDDPPAGIAPLPAVRAFDARQILESYRVRYMFVEVLQPEFVRRLDSQNATYRRAFENAAVVLFELRPSP